jgi:tRNA A37 N6-isopentenylltransferase MiaA
LINADIQQMYRGTEVLAATPTQSEMDKADHRLFRVLDCNEKITPLQWLGMAQREIEDALDRDKIPVLVGGSRRLATLLAKVAYGISLKSPHKVDADKANFPYELHTIVLSPPFTRIRKEISRRVKREFQAVTVELFDAIYSGVNVSSPGYALVGVEELKEMLIGDTTADAAQRDMTMHAHFYAKKQRDTFEHLGDELTRRLPTNVRRISSIESTVRIAEAMRFISGVQ